MHKERRGQDAQPRDQDTALYLQQRNGALWLQWSSDSRTGFPPAPSHTPTDGNTARRPEGSGRNAVLGRRATTSAPLRPLRPFTRSLSRPWRWQSPRRNDPWVACGPQRGHSSLPCRPPLPLRRSGTPGVPWIRGPCGQRAAYRCHQPPGRTEMAVEMGPGHECGRWWRTPAAVEEGQRRGARARDTPRARTRTCTIFTSDCFSPGSTWIETDRK